jgi:hypothetical protein
LERDISEENFFQKKRNFVDDLALGTGKGLRYFMLEGLSAGLEASSPSLGGFKGTRILCTFSIFSNCWSLFRTTVNPNPGFSESGFSRMPASGSGSGD